MALIGPIKHFCSVASVVDSATAADKETHLSAKTGNSIIIVIIYYIILRH